MTKAQKIFFILIFISISAYAETEQNIENAHRRLREFIVMGYSGISYDINDSSGPYMRTLLELMNVPLDQHLEVISKLKKMIGEYPNIMDFADQVVLMRGNVQTQAHAKVEAEAFAPMGPHIYRSEQIEPAMKRLTKGMNVTLYLKYGGQVKGTFDDFNGRRIWLRGTTKKSFTPAEILALECPDL